ncbi:hypothetical protein HKD37_19G053320 [Glycine soja]
MHRSPKGNLVPLDLEIEATLRRNRAERRKKLLEDRTIASILEEEVQSSDYASSYSPSSWESTTDLPEASVMAEEHQHRVTLEDYTNSYVPQFFTKGKAAISSFHQFPDESLSEALERFCGLLRKTLTHGFFEPIQLNMFIDGLRPQSKQLLDASVGGKIELKTCEEATELIENMSTSDHAILCDRVHQPTKKSLLELSSQDALLAQNNLLSNQLEVAGCTICGGAHESGHYISIEEHTQEVNYMGNQKRQGYNQGGFSGFQQGPYNQQGQWRSHPSNQFNKDQEGPSNRPPQQGPNLFQRTTKLEETLAQFMQVTMSNHKSTDSALKNLEIQVGQLAKQIAEKSSSIFGENTEKNPKEECKAAMTRSRKLVAADDEDIVALKEQVVLNDTTDKENDEEPISKCLLAGEGGSKGGPEVVLEEGETLPAYSRFCRLRSNPQEIEARLCIPHKGFVLNAEGQPWKLLRKDTLAQTWSVPSYSNLAPTSHTLDLNMDRASSIHICYPSTSTSRPIYPSSFIHSESISGADIDNVELVEWGFIKTHYDSGAVYGEGSLARSPTLSCEGRTPQVTVDPPSPMVDLSYPQQAANPPTLVLEMPDDPATPVLRLTSTPPVTPVLQFTDEEDTQDQDTQQQDQS